MGKDVAFWLGLALILGITLAVQIPLNGRLSQFVGLIQTAVIVHATGLVTALVVMAILLRGNLLQWGAIGGAPWYAFVGGCLGVLIVLTYSYLVQRLGTTLTASLVIAAQLLTGLILDQFGWM